MSFIQGDWVKWNGYGQEPACVTEVDHINHAETPYHIQFDNGDACWVAREEIFLIGQPSDVVNSPSHYTKGEFEVIDIIEDAEVGYRLGNALKYILRCEHKGNKKQDLEKAIWYLKREVENCK
ncbi:DUF3310 domain-containing protein [Streptomyces albulus]|nr:DUF3310 domain-containing protein [Streptomyces noursei]